MAFIVASGDRQFRIDARLLESGSFDDTYLVFLDDIEYRLSISRITPTHLSILIGNRSYNVEVERNGDEYKVNTRGEVFSFKVHDERSATVKIDSDSGESVIAAPMPGLVVKILVSEGDEVQAGDKLLVLEAMKMQNEIASPGSGTVAGIFVDPGDSVMTGDQLIAIE